MPYYAIANGRKTGVVQTWKECESQVAGYKNVRYKKFKTEAEAAAFVLDYGSSAKQPASVDYSHRHKSAVNNNSRITKPKTTPSVYFLGSILWIYRQERGLMRATLLFG